MTNSIQPVKKPAILAVFGLIIGLVLGLAIGPLVQQAETTTVVTTAYQTVERTTTLTETRVTTITETVEILEKRQLPPLKLEIKYAKLFDVTFYDGYKVVRDALNRTLILVPRGAEPPQDVEGVVIYTPVERVVLLSATHVALLERLKELKPDILGSVVGIAWGGSYEWYFQDVKKALEEGSIKDVGAAWSPNLEEIVALKPDLMVIYTFPGDTLPGKLDELGIPYVVDNEWLENHPLGRFEWIKFIATFYDLDYEAAQIFANVEETVKELRELVSGSAAPRVAWFSVYKGTVYASGGRSYVVVALKELGADYIFSDTTATGSVTPTMEELVSRAADADVIVYASDIIASIEDLLKEVPGLADSKAVKEGRVYIFSKTYWQLGFAYTEEWYRDLAAILYPELFPDYEPQFFIRLASGG
ncbi:MAG: ABC transporter substrate-binding protein [Aigarchaeota archaeon]|nr:ABC transporter substrate-binding protein [Candidatus Pelearchaeum maunauluense]